jgi:hypothetical protein
LVLTTNEPGSRLESGLVISGGASNRVSVHLCGGVIVGQNRCTAMAWVQLIRSVTGNRCGFANTKPSQRYGFEVSGAAAR